MSPNILIATALLLLGGAGYGSMFAANKKACNILGLLLFKCKSCVYFLYTHLVFGFSCLWLTLSRHTGISAQ